MEELKNLPFNQDEEGEVKTDNKKEIGLGTKQAEKIDIRKLTELRCLVDKKISQRPEQANFNEYGVLYDQIYALDNAEIIRRINNFGEELELVDSDPLLYNALLDAATQKGLDRQHFRDK